MATANQPAEMTSHRTAKVRWWFPSRMMATPMPNRLSRRNTRQTHGVRTDRESCTSHFSVLVALPTNSRLAGRAGAGAPLRGVTRPVGLRAMALDCIRSRLSRANPHDGVDGRDPDLPVTDLVGAGRLGDGVDDPRDGGVVDQHLDPDLRGEGDLVLGAAVHLGVSLLAAESLGLAYGQPLGAGGLEGLLDGIELERLDDGGYEHHQASPPMSAVTAVGAGAGAVRPAWANAPPPTPAPVSSPTRVYPSSEG